MGCTKKDSDENCEKLSLALGTIAQVSVIIPTWDSQEYIEDCICSILNQSYKNIEIIVIDRFSTDDTLEIVKRHRGVRILLKGGGRSAQRNYGARYAAGQFLLFIDSDEFATPELIQECVSLCSSEKIDAIYVTTFDTGNSYIAKSRILGDIIAYYSLKNRVNLPNSPIRFCRSSVFEDIGGFDPELVIGEDVVFGEKINQKNYAVARAKNVIVHHTSESIRKEFLKKYNYGKNLRNFTRKSRFVSESYTKVFLLYLLSFQKHPRYARYLPGFVSAKLLQVFGLLIGYLLYSF
ncbi:MAG: glycosyltransferase [Candidatus Bathyarchaeota archaeon]|nr:glycosyltransferase [Candidatus Bathyarchaeota archaeon]